MAQRICGECLEDLLDRLERRALNASELQQVMVLDARLEQWAMMQCDPWRQRGRTGAGTRSWVCVFVWRSVLHVLCGAFDMYTYIMYVSMCVVATIFAKCLVEISQTMVV